ncbi:MAG: peptidylprolyl isomerase [Gammaproteobacteria bacterium]|nr:peptidylprolyl isomerase [Gammaproteobacteria bacterium]
MKHSRLCTVIALAALVAACQPKGEAEDPAAQAAKKPVATEAAKKPVATINGKSITQGEFDAFVKQVAGRAVADLDADQKLHVLGAQAEKDGLDKKADLAAEIALTRLNILQQAIATKYLEGKTPTEQELKVEYYAQVAQMSRNEYKARHILVPTEIAATQILERLKKGERFKALAKDSLDSSSDNGGDLGWFSPASMVKPFADAVMALKKGETIAKPVQTQFGWHVIRLDDVREVQPPPFEQVKQQLNQAVRAKKFRAYSDELRKAAKIEKKI